MIKTPKPIEQLTTFNSQDSTSIQQLVLKLGSNSQPLKPKDFASIAASPNTFLFVARDQGKIIGMITLLIFRIPYIKKAFIEDVIVDDAYRGQGIGTVLLQKVIDLAKKKKVGYITLTSRPERTASHGLYKKFGFKKKETNVYQLTFHYDQL